MTVYLFWTGGFDSTFRLCQLLFEEGKDVQPLYVSDQTLDNRQGSKWKRRSWRQERQCMFHLMDLIRKRNPPGKLLNPIEYNKIPTSPRVDLCMADLAARGLMIRSKRQHGTLAEVTLDLAHPVEICLVKDETFQRSLPAGAFIGQRGECRLTRKVKRRVPSLRIFSRFRFPLIYQNKKELFDHAKKQDFADLLEQTWSCWFPKENRPCGRCEMCRHRPVKTQYLGLK